MGRAADGPDRVHPRRGGRAAGAARVRLLEADHSYEATTASFEAIVPHLAPQAVVVVDDIKLDDEMARAWEAIRTHRRVAARIGLRRVGIVVAA